jgi:hypothetical protein
MGNGVGNEGENMAGDKWVRNVMESPAYLDAGRVLTVLQDARATNENGALDLSRARRMAERVIWLLENCDPYLMPQPALDNAAGPLASAIDSATAYRSDPTQEQYLAGAMSGLDAALIHLAPAAIPLKNVKVAEQAAQLGRTIDDRQTATLQAVDAAVGEARELLAEAIEELAAQRVETEQARSQLSATREELELLRASTLSLAGTMQSAFTQEQTDRAAQFRVELNTARSDLAATVGDAMSQSNDLLKEISLAKDQASEIVGLISDGALVGEPSRKAKIDQKSAFWWSMSAVAFGALAVGAALLTLLKHVRNDPDWSGVVLRTLVVIAVAGVGAYAATQAKEHRVAQREQERLAVRLIAIGPFLRDMDPAARDVVLSTLAEKLLAGEVSAEPAASAELPAGAAQLIQILVSALRK